MLPLTLVVRASHSTDALEVQTQDPSVASLHSTIDCGAEPCDAVARGLVAFFDRRLHKLDGNGRSCADCHMASDHFQLSPASAEARFQELELRRQTKPDADDPLFRPIDADDFRTNGNSASDFSNLRENGLVRITFPLPPNIRLVDPITNLPSAELSVDVWRMVPSVNDVAITGPDGGTPWFRGPNQRGGYQLDARLTTLQEQALGAFINHAQTMDPVPQQTLDDLASFQRVLFTNPRVRELADAMNAGTLPLPDPDPPLDELEQQGKVVFQRACAQCHGGQNQSTPAGAVIRFHSVSTQCPRPVDPAGRWAYAACPPRLARNARTYEITLPAQFGGGKVRRVTSDPGRALLTGYVGGAAPQDDWNKFDINGLRGLSQTAPYFHNNSADTLEAVVDHYIEFFKQVKAVAPPPPAPLPPIATTDGVHFDRAPLPEERAALLAYLRML